MMNGSLRRVMRVALRRKRRVLVAALCAASFLTGQMLFGEEAQPRQSRISQYMQAKIRLISGADDEALTPAKTQASAATSSRRAASSSEAAAPASDKSAASPAPDDFRQALQRAVAGDKPSDAAGAGPVQVLASPLPLENKSAGEENLPPIIPASAMPRPRPKGPQVIVPPQPSAATTRSPAPAAPAPSKIQTPKPSPWRINLGGKLLPSISVGEQETPPPPPSQAPANPQSSPSSAAPPSPSDRWNLPPNSAAGQTAGAVHNPFATQQPWSGAAQAEAGMPRTLFPSPMPPATPSGIAPPASPEFSVAPRPYPMPLEIINPNVTRRPVVPAGTTEPVRTVAAPPLITAQPAGAPGESNPLRSTYHEPGLLAAPASADAAKEDPASNLKRIEAAMVEASDGGAKQKSSRRRYMLEK